MIVPPRREQPTATIGSDRDSGLVQLFAIPKLAGDLAMRLIESLAIIRIRATAHLLASSEFHLSKPIRIGECLSRHADDVCVVTLQNLFGLIERSNTASRNDRRRESRIIHREFNLRDQWD